MHQRGELTACQTAPGYWTKLSLESLCANTVKYSQGFINRVGYV